MTVTIRLECVLSPPCAHPTTTTTSALQLSTAPAPHLPTCCLPCSPPRTHPLKLEPPPLNAFFCGVSPQRQNLLLEYGWARPDHDVLWKNVEGKDLGGQQCRETSGPRRRGSEFSEQSNISSWARDYSRGMLAKNVAGLFFFAGLRCHWQVRPPCS